MSEKPKTYYTDLHKAYLKNMMRFKYSFERGNKDLLKRHLDGIKKLPKRSISGEKALEIYERAKKLGLYKYSPVIIRVYLGQILLKLKSDDSAGFVKFIKFVELEAEFLHPLLKSQIDEVIKLTKKYGGRSSGAAEYFKPIEGIKVTENPRTGREKDPIFGDDNLSVSEKENKMGSLESLNLNVEKLTNLDPFQIIVYKLLIEKGYKEFKAKIMNKTGGWKKLFARKEGVQAINRFQKWIVGTTRAMSFTKGKDLLSEFNSRVSQLNFPSLKIKVAGIIVADHRAKAKRMVTAGLNKMKPLLKGLTGFPPVLYKIIGRRHGYATGKNRVFLNRFHQISFNRFKSASGDQKYMYEFIALALDRIKDDHEFAKLSNAMKPVIARLLQGTPIIDSLSKKVFKKPVSQLTQKQIVSLLDYVLPRTALTKQQKQSDLNKKMLGVLKEAANHLGSLRKTDLEKFRLIANILHIAKNDIVEIGTEKDPGKAKKKLAEFVARFDLARGLIGEEIMRKIKESNKPLYMFLTEPETSIGFACLFNENIAYVKTRFETVSKIKKPPVVISVLQDARITKKYLKKRFKQVLASRNVTLIQKYGNQMRAVDMAIGILNNCWTQAQFKKKEGAIRQILHDTPFLVVSKNVQKYIDLIATSNVEKAKRNYKSLLGVTYDVEIYLSSIVKNKLLVGRYSFARGRLSTMISKIVASYGEFVARENRASGIDTYVYLKKNHKIFVETIVARINSFLKSVKFRDKNGKNYKLYGLNKVQVALLKRKTDRYLSRKVLPKVKEAMQA